MIRRFGWRASLALVALLTSCGKSRPDSQSGTKPEGASGNSKAEPSAPVEVVTSSGIEMVALPGGEFLMGSDRGNADEAPPHKVRISAFLIDRFEVTHEMFAKAQLPNPSHWQDNPRKPVERVRWRDAKQYCNERSLLEKLKPCYNENKESPPLDPTGPPNPGKDVKRVMRGGSWKASADMCRATLRQGERTGDSDACFFTDYCGFRCVRRAAPEELQQLRSNMRKIAP